MKFPDNVLETIDIEFSKAKSLILIGAMDGVFVEEFYPYIMKYGNSLENVLLVEPIPRFFEKLQETYKEFSHFKYENSAIGEQDGTQRMVTIKEGAPVPDWLWGCSMFGETFTNLLAGVTDESLKEHKEFLDVPVLTFDSLLKKHDMNTVDILKIDAESQDWNILKQVDLEQLSPPIISYEIFHLQSTDKINSVKYCSDNGYKILFNDDVIVAHKERINED